MQKIKASRTWAPSMRGSKKHESYKVPKRGGKWEAKIGGMDSEFGYMDVFGFWCLFSVGEGVEGPEIGSVREHGSEDRNM